MRLFIDGTLCQFPFIGKRLPGRDVYECWIPRTRIVVWYKVGDDVIEIAMLWHTSQDRFAGE
ncbi:MAG: hypothetical protein ACT4N2_10195 [Hyphomicrobium sp.]